MATLLSVDDTRVYVVDPPGDEESPNDYSEKPERLDERRWRVRDDKAFANATKLISQAKLLSYAGADTAAYTRLERARVLPERTGRTPEREKEVNENEFGTFTGVLQSIAVKDRVNVEVFQALDNQVFEAILAEDSQRLTEEMRDLRDRTAAASQDEPSQPIVVSHDQSSITVKTAGPDGSLLQVRVSTP